MRFLATIALLVFSITSGKAFADFPWNSRTDCYGELRTEKSVTVGWGRWSYTKTIYIPPEPTILALCYSVKAADSAFQNFAATRGVYGNFCGGGWRSKKGGWLSSRDANARRRLDGDYRPPSDSLDVHCKAHDWCYIDKHTLSLGCDLEAAKGFCSEAAKDGGQTHIAQQAGGMCVAWNRIVVPLATNWTPLFVSGCRISSRVNQKAAKYCRGI